MKKVDYEELEYLNKFNKEIQIVFTKVDNVNHYNNINYLTEATNYIKTLRNVRSEIFLTSSKYFLFFNIK